MKLFRRVLFSVRSRALLSPSQSQLCVCLKVVEWVSSCYFRLFWKDVYCEVVNYRLPQVFCPRSLQSWISVKLPSGFLSVSIFFGGAKEKKKKGPREHRFSFTRQTTNLRVLYKIMLAHLAKCNKKEQFAVILPLKYGIQVKKYPLNDVLSNLVHCSALALIATLRVTFGAW